MRILIICIDRDNDLGEKAGVLSPIIGRAANLDAAIKLGSADPEDSDTNTIFGGINVYDGMIAENKDVEIVSIAGDKKVGILADRKISEQLDKILEELRPERAMLVSDGAEDESVLPLIQSRIKVDAVHRIIVKQHENLESTYYIIKQAFNDPKISHTFFMPLGLAFMIYAISLYAQRPEVAIIAIGILFWSGSSYILVISGAMDNYPLIANGRQFLISTILGAIAIATIGARISIKAPRNASN